MQTHLLPFRRAGRADERARLIDQIGRDYRRRWGVDLAVDVTDWTLPQLSELAAGLAAATPARVVAADRSDLAQSA